MALIGLTLILASISLFFCRSQALSTVGRLWPAPLDKKRDRRKIAENQPQPRPSITLNGLLEEVELQLNMPPPLSPKVKSKAVSEPKLPTSSQKPAESSTNQAKVNDSELMPPPPPPRRTPTSTRSGPTNSTTTALRVPTTGPLPNRGPPSSNSLSRPSANTLRPTPATSSTLPLASRPRKKVLLAPGHSPLDWATKTRTDPPQSLSGVPYPQRITPSQLANATGRRGKPAWSAYKGRVYNIGPYLPFHPGGEVELMRAAGRDGQPLFDDIHSWVNWENMLEPCFVGWLVSEEAGAEGAGLDALD